VALEEAKRGNTFFLMTRLRMGAKLTDAEIEFICKALRELMDRRFVQAWAKVAIAREVMALTDGGMKQEAAVEQVRQQTGISRRQIFIALKAARGVDLRMKTPWWELVQKLSEIRTAP
jgi:hypothetical protein